MVFFSVKLFEDEFGVVHWRYSMDGVLLLCGSRHAKGRRLGLEGVPTCFLCLVIYDRDSIGSDVWASDTGG